MLPRLITSSIRLTKKFCSNKFTYKDSQIGTFVLLLSCYEPKLLMDLMLYLISEGKTLNLYIKIFQRSYKLQFIMYGDTNKMGTRTFKNSVSLTVMYYSNLILQLGIRANLARVKNSFKIQALLQLIKPTFWST